MLPRLSRRLLPGIFCSLLALVSCSAAIAQGDLSSYLQGFEKKITVKVLPNGLTLILCERHDAPVFSYTTFVDAGDVTTPPARR